MKQIRTFINEARAAIKEGTHRQNMKTFFLHEIAKNLVKILSTLSKSKRIANLIRFQPGSFGFFLGDTYFVTYNAGLMSCSTTTLSDITASKRTVKKVQSNFGMSLYKKWLLGNNWKSFYQSPLEPNKAELASGDSNSYPSGIHDWWERDYATIPIAAVQKMVDSFFRPSAKVQQLAQLFINKYQIALEDTVGVHYRGTDKQTEIETPSFNEFIEQTKKAARGMTSPRVLLLTDEPDAVTAFESAFPGSVIVIDELAAPGGSIGAHILNSKEPELQGQVFLAILSLVSRSKKVVTHTGNGALWEVLFRGSAADLTQVRTS